MKIKNLTIENFKVFEKVHFDFSTDDKPVVLVQGLNSAGKSSVFEAIKWCLYGDVSPLISSEIDYFHRANLAEAKSNKEVRMTVRLEFESRGKNYQLTRRAFFENPRKHETTVRMLDMEQNAAVNESDISRRIEEFLPPRIKEFMLYDGESQELFEKMGQGNSVLLEQSIKDLLGVPLIEDLVRGIRKRYDDEVNKNLAITTGNTKANKLRKEISDLRAREAKEREDVANWKNDMFETEEKIHSLKQKADQYDEFNSVVKAEDNALAEVRSLQQQIAIRNREMIESLGQQFWVPALGKIQAHHAELKDLEAAWESFADKKAELTSQLVGLAKLASQDVCPTCSQSHGIPEEELKTKAEKLNQALNELEDNAPTNPAGAKSLLLDIGFTADAERAFKRNYLQMNDLKVKLVGAKQVYLKAKAVRGAFSDEQAGLGPIVDDYNRAVQHLPYAKSKYDEARKTVDSTLAEIDKRQKELQTIPLPDAPKDNSETYRLILEVFNQASHEYLGLVRSKVTEYASEAFNGLSDQVGKYDGVLITDEFAIRPVLKQRDENGEPVLEMNLNQAHRKMIAISLVQAMLHVAHGEDAFLFLDNPDTALDGVREEAVYEWVANSPIPLCLFVLPDEETASGNWTISRKHLDLIKHKIQRHLEIWHPTAEETYSEVRTLN